MREAARAFVLVADDVNPLQVGGGLEAEYFQRLARQGHARGQAGVTQQGIYCFRADGELLASDNTRDPDRMIRCLRAALVRWRERAQADGQGQLAGQKPRLRGEHFYPGDGLVLRLFVRDLGKNRRALGDYENPWNTDMVWFSAAEVRAFVPAEVNMGASHDLPAYLSRRLARLHLLDSVLGQGLPFPDRSIHKALLTVAITGLQGDRVALRLTGATEAADGQRGITTQLLGRATYDRGKKAFSAFELLAVGTRRGGRFPPYVRNDTGSGSIGFAFVLAGSAPADRVAPAHFLAYGWR